MNGWEPFTRRIGSQEWGLGQCLFELTRFSSQVLDLIRSGRTCRIIGKPLLALRPCAWTDGALAASVQKLLRPAMVEVLGNTFLAAQLSDCFLAAKALQHNADLLFCRKLPPGCSTYIPNRLLRAIRIAPVSLRHRFPPRGYDGLEAIS